MTRPLICVAHGHGGSNHGCRSEDGTLVESRLTVSLASKVAALGRPLVLLATALDTDLTPAEVRGIAERAGCKAVVEIHFDDAGPARQGALFCYRGAEARALGCEICAALGGDWTAWPMPDPRFPRASALAAGYEGIDVVILEVANLGNSTDCVRLRRVGALDTIAAHIAAGIEAWYRAENKETP